MLEDNRKKPLRKVIFRIRRLMWHIMGVDYESSKRKIDYTFLKDDPYTTMGIKSYENGAIISRSGTAKIQI